MTTDQTDGGIGPCLNPFTLPYVDLDDKTDLPSSPGLYFVIDGEALLYIGRSKDLNQRWKGHHRYKQIKATAKNPQIAFLDCDDETLLWVERDVINRFNPTLNDTPVNKPYAKTVTSKHNPQNTVQDAPVPESPDDEHAEYVEQALTALAELPSYKLSVLLKSAQVMVKKKRRQEFQAILSAAVRLTGPDGSGTEGICRMFTECISEGRFTITPSTSTAD
jgi:hypothetical protein